MEDTMKPPRPLYIVFATEMACLYNRDRREESLYSVDEDYHIVVACYPADVMIQVRTYMRYGLEPLGSLVVIDNGDGKPWFFQTMVRPKNARI